MTKSWVTQVTMDHCSIPTRVWLKIPLPRQIMVCNMKFPFPSPTSPLYMASFVVAKYLPVLYSTREGDISLKWLLDLVGFRTGKISWVEKRLVTIAQKDGPYSLFILYWHFCHGSHRKVVPWPELKWGWGHLKWWTCKWGRTGWRWTTCCDEWIGW